MILLLGFHLLVNHSASKPKRNDKEAYFKVSPDLPSGCLKSEPCKMDKLPNGEVVGSAIPDSRRKILLEYSPKADSTASIVMFLNEMGYIHGLNYSGFAHQFRQDIFNRKCGMVTPCMYLDKGWFRFKVTRNPFDRAPSSFIHSFRTGLVHDVWNKYEMEYRSFYDFVLYLKTHINSIDRLFGRHACLQSSVYERMLSHRGIRLFHEIVHCEDPLPSIEKINEIKGTHYSLNFSSKHFVKRNGNVHKFVGKTPWKELKNNIPEDYGCFYNQEIKDIVHDLYLTDLALYGYTFPFSFPLESKEDPFTFGANKILSATEEERPNIKEKHPNELVFVEGVGLPTLVERSIEEPNPEIEKGTGKRKPKGKSIT